LATLLMGGMHGATAQGDAVTPDSVHNFAESTFNSDVFKGFVSSYQQQNVGVVNSINAAAIAQAKAALPKAEEVGTQLKYGTHNVVSSAGETYVTWMIEATRAKPAERKVMLGKLADLAARRNPEAMTFQGFVAEYGLFDEPRNVSRALDWYRAAAAMNYQPALYNLALAAAYGKGQAADLNNAGALVAQAAQVAPEASYRVCGFAAFIAYRKGDRAQAAQFSQGCWSDLAGLPRALYDTRVSLAQKVTMLRHSIGTGIDDGYALLEQVTRDAAPEPQYLACKYALLNRQRRALNSAALKDDAERCYRASSLTPKDPKEAALRATTVVPGIIGFVPTELRELERLRASNRFHYGWSVPYLPFRQQDVDLFAALFNPVKR
jgi:TPR repeat protein